MFEFQLNYIPSFHMLAVHVIAGHNIKHYIDEIDLPPLVCDLKLRNLLGSGNQ